MKGRILKALVLCLVAVLLVKLINHFSSEAQKPEKYEKIEGRVHGTFYKITYKPAFSGQSLDGLDSLFHRFDLSLSTFNDSSIISCINKNEDVEVDTFFANVFNTAYVVSSNSNGAFDMTVAPLVNAWGFGFKHKDNVSSGMIDSLLSHVGYGKVRLEGRRVVKSDSLVMLDASAIAKGYSCDVVAGFIESKGISDYLVEIGGEIVAKGFNPQGKEWVVGIEKPLDDSTMAHNGLQEIIHLKDFALATSGNYRQFYYRDGKKFSHTVDPKTGYPVEHSLLSASVVAQNCMTADAYATAFMVLGLEPSLRLADSLPNLEAYFIYSGEDGAFNVKYTKGFEEYFANKK